MWVGIGFSDLFSGNLLQEEMEHRNVRFAREADMKRVEQEILSPHGMTLHPDTLESFYHLKTKVRNSPQFETEVPHLRKPLRSGSTRIAGHRTVKSDIIYHLESITFMKKES